MERERIEPAQAEMFDAQPGQDIVSQEVNADSLRRDSGVTSLRLISIDGKPIFTPIEYIHSSEHAGDSRADLRPDQIQLADTTGKMLTEVTRPDKHQKRMDIRSTVDHATKVGRAIESTRPREGTILNAPYNIAAEVLYHPELLLNGIVSAIASEKSASSVTGLFATQDLLRTVYEEHFPEFRGQVGDRLRGLATFVKTVAPVLQFIPILDGIGDGIMIAADAAEGKSLARLGLDGAITAVDSLTPLPGDIALLSPGLDKSERILRYSLMETLFLGMSDPSSPLYEQRQQIAKAVLDTKSFVATAANATLLDQEKSIGAKVGALSTDNAGDVYLKILGLFKIKLTQEGQSPDATVPFAKRLQKSNPHYAQEKRLELREKSKTQGLTNDEQMQLAMCNLLIQARMVSEGKTNTVDSFLLSPPMAQY